MPIGTETLTVVRPPGKDGFGNALPGSPQTWDVAGWLFAPGPSREDLAGAAQVETDGTVYGPTVVDIEAVVPDGIKPSDRLRIRGDDYEVVGRVQDWGEEGTVILLKLVTG